MSAKIEDLASRRAQRKANRPATDEPSKPAAGDHVDPPPGQGAVGRCPICGRPRSAAHRPFCSARCAEIDLGRWLKESYRVPTQEEPNDTDSDESN